MRLAICLERVEPRRGGAETYVADLCRRLIGAGCSVELFAESWDEQALHPSVVRRRVESRGWNRRARIWSFARNAEAALAEARDRYDCSIGFINTWAQDLLIPQGGVHPASLECNSKRFPAGWRRAFYKALKRSNPKFGQYLAIEREQYRPDRETMVVAVSRMVQGHLETYYQVPRDRTRIIPNAIDASRFAADDTSALRSRVRGEFGLARDDLVGLFVGHNFWLKGLAPLLEALAERRRDQPRARPIQLLVCGGGKLAPFRKRVERLGLSDVVKLAGFYPDVRACYWASDFFVSPTYYDPCSLVAFEALACGLPVITTTCNGAGEVLTPGRDGFVISEPDDRPALRAALERMTDDEDRVRMSRAAMDLGRAQSFDKHLERLLAAIEETAERRERQPRRAGHSHPNAHIHANERVIRA